MSKAASVFATWDEEYDKFSNVLREIVKKKRDEGLKLSWRVNPAHKRLQDRIAKMTEYVVCCRGILLFVAMGDWCQGNTTTDFFFAGFENSTSNCKR